jgi:hypothetical protein
MFLVSRREMIDGHGAIDADCITVHSFSFSSYIIWHAGVVAPSRNKNRFV